MMELNETFKPAEPVILSVNWFDVSEKVFNDKDILPSRLC